MTVYAQIVSQRSPMEEKRIKGPEIPIDDNITGVSSKPMTLPM